MHNPPARAILSRAIPFAVACALACITIAACDAAIGPAGGGTVIIGTGQDPETLFPPLADGIQARELTELLFDRLADRGPALNTLGDAGYVPRLAERWEWSPDSLRVTFHLNRAARWTDGHPVTANDVRFAFQVIVDSLTGSRLAGDLRAVVDSVSVGDSTTCTAWFRQRSAERFDALVTSLTPLPEHLLRTIRHDSLALSPFAHAPVGDGAFTLVRYDPQQRIEIVPNAAYYGARAKLSRVIWAFAPDAATLLKQFMAGESDFLETISTVEDAAAVARRADLRVVKLGSFGYNFLQFNLHDGASTRPHPLFGDRALRRALTMALDRGLLVRSVFDTLGRTGLGPFVRAQWSADTTISQIPFDRAAAARALDSLGWRAGADGMRARNGRPLAFTLLVSVASKPRQQMAVLIQEQLRQAGVNVSIEKVDQKALGERVAAKHTFDAVMSGLAATPSPSGIRQTWTKAAAVSGFNFGGYMSGAFDAEVDSAITATSPVVARAHYRAAYQTIVDDAPAIWLYEPPSLAGANARVELGPVRADAWWMSLPAWTIAPGKRLPRDAAPKSP